MGLLMGGSSRNLNDKSMGGVTARIDTKMTKIYVGILRKHIERDDTAQ